MHNMRGEHRLDTFLHVHLYIIIFIIYFTMRTTVDLTDEERKSLKRSGLTLRGAIRLGIGKTRSAQADQLRDEFKGIRRTDIIKHLARVRPKDKRAWSNPPSNMHSGGVYLSSYWLQLEYHARLLYTTMTALNDSVSDYINSKESDNYAKRNK